jgi:membrane protein
LSTATERLGRVPKGPLRLSLGEWVAAVKRSFKEFLADDAMGLASQIAFSAVLAFFPTMIFLVGLLDLVNGFDALRGFIDPVAPEAVTQLINDISESATGAGSVLALLLGAAGAIWAASGAMGTVIKAVNRAYGRVESRPFWMLRLVAIALVLLSALSVGLVLALIVLGGPLGEAIADQAGLGGAFAWLWDLLRWPLAFVAILLFFALVYYIAPDDRMRSWRWISPGSLLGSLLWLAVSALFALYTSLSSSYNETYGSIAGGIVLLLWLYYSAFALLFGAELNSELDRQAEIRAAGGADAGLTRPGRRGR